jgi:hypothetical protein
MQAAALFTKKRVENPVDVKLPPSFAASPRPRLLVG